MSAMICRCVTVTRHPLQPQVQNFKIEKTCGCDLLAAGLAEMKRFELLRPVTPDLPHFEFYEVRVRISQFRVSF